MIKFFIYKGLKHSSGVNKLSEEEKEKTGLKK
jgi:hypothetical protein